MVSSNFAQSQAAPQKSARAPRRSVGRRPGHHPITRIARPLTALIQLLLQLRQQI